MWIEEQSKLKKVQANDYYISYGENRDRFMLTDRR